MSTHKITPETKVPFPCWLYLVRQLACARFAGKTWYYITHKTDAAWMTDFCSHYSTNTPDQPPLGEPAPEGSLPVTEPEKCEVCGGDEPCSHDFDKIGWPTPSAPSLQSVAEGAANEIQAVFYKESWGAVIPNPATVKEILTRHFAPLLTAREVETRDWIKWHGDLQEKWQDAQAARAALAVMEGRNGA